MKEQIIPMKKTDIAIMALEVIAGILPVIVTAWIAVQYYLASK